MTRHNDSVTATEDLTAWIREQLDADEATEWPHRPSCQMLKPAPAGFLGKSFSCDCDAAGRWYREIEVKRRRLARHQPMGNGCCDYCHEWGGELVAWPCVEIRDDASVYADRPGYRDEWRP